MSTSPPAPEGSGQRLLLPTIAIGTMLAPLNSTMIAVALPDIQKTFDASVTSTAWLVTIYLIAMAVGQPIGGRLGDLYGRRPVYLIGLLWFAAASLGCAFAPDLVWLIVFRLQQAIAGTLVFPNGAALVREAIPEGRRGMAFGMVGLAAATAAASGPPLGGILAATLGWASIFWANVPLIAIALVLGWRCLPRGSGSGGGRRRFDVAGTALLALSLSTLIMIPTLLKIDRLAIAVLAAVAVAGFGWSFVRWERRVAAPLVDMSLFGRPHFAAACASILLGNLVMYTTLLAIPLYLEGVRDQSLRTTGLMLAAMSAFAAFSTPLGGRWADRHGRWLPAVTGASFVFCGALLLAIGVLVAGTVLLVIALTVLGLGIGISGAAVQTAAVESVPGASAGSASGIYSTSRYIGSVVGSSVLAMVFVRQPDSGDARQFVLIFAGLAVVAIAGIVANANVASRHILVPRPGRLSAQER